jgi:hypothetical protein
MGCRLGCVRLLETAPEADADPAPVTFVAIHVVANPAPLSTAIDLVRARRRTFYLTTDLTT